MPLDSAYLQPHTSAMAPPSSVVEVTDPRDDRRRLRVSWHPERRQLIVSHWRDNVCIATKVGLNWANREVFRDASRARIQKEVEDSLRRLRTDVIDIY